MNPVNQACRQASQDYIENLRLKSVGLFLQNDTNSMPLLKLKSYLGINFKYLAKVVDDELYFTLSAPLSDSSVENISISVSQFGKHQFYKKVL